MRHKIPGGTLALEANLTTHTNHTESKEIIEKNILDAIAVLEKQLWVQEMTELLKFKVSPLSDRPPQLKNKAVYSAGFAIAGMPVFVTSNTDITVV